VGLFHILKVVNLGELKEGLDFEPVITTIGALNRIFNKGELKLSIDGSRVAMASDEMVIVEAFEFDNITGRLSHPITFNEFNSLGTPFGVAFSPNTRFLYVTSGFGSVAILQGESEVYQYDLSIGSQESIEKRRITLSQDQSNSGMQLGTDGRIYVAGIKDGFISSAKGDFLSVINSPNDQGFDADFEFVGFETEGRKPRAALPNFIQSFFTQCRFKVKFPADTVLLCGDETLEINYGERAGTYTWSTGANSASLSMKDPGRYWVQHNDRGCVSADTVVIMKPEEPTEPFPKDTILICEGESRTFNFSQPGIEFLWEDSTTEGRTVTQPGVYRVQAFNDCYHLRDSVVVAYRSLFVPNVFTPNLDGVNETFQIEGASDLTCYLQIFDRRGILIFEDLEYDNNWNGEGQATGVYYYEVRFKEIDKHLNGWVSVVR